MTMPIERTYAVLATRIFLEKRFATSQDQSEKAEIQGLLRHFPTSADILHHAKIAEAYYPPLFEPMFGFQDETSPDRLRTAIAKDKELRSR